MKRIVQFLAAATVILMVLCSASDSTPQQQYIDKWASTAVKEMYRSGVPASITLAQGILESRSGQSPLASEGNNHFGIKCHSDWKGKTMKYDDDRKGECFRVYGDAEDSFRDHSDFLRYQDRYKFLFDFDTKDYESWAYGLKKAGYATDPAYPSKLIKIINDYDLSRFDRMTQAQATKVSSKEKKVAEMSSATKAKEKPKKVTNHQEKKSRSQEAVPDVIPQSPTIIEQAKKYERTVSEEFHFNVSREVFTMNGVPFVYSFVGETYESIAAANNLFYKEILKINDLSRDQQLLPGTVVYLEMKKKQAAAGLDKYIVESDSESLRDICQRFGVRQKSIEKLNGFKAGHLLREGDTILLRKQ